MYHNKMLISFSPILVELQENFKIGVREQKSNIDGTNHCSAYSSLPSRSKERQKVIFNSRLVIYHENPRFRSDLEQAFKLVFFMKYPKIPNKGRTSNKMGAPLFWTSDGIISKTVCPIYLKIDVLIVHIGHSQHTEFQVNRKKC